jgi:hypothetical protein
VRFVRQGEEAEHVLGLVSNGALRRLVAQHDQVLQRADQASFGVGFGAEPSEGSDAAGCFRGLVATEALELYFVLIDTGEQEASEILTGLDGGSRRTWHGNSS